MKEETDGNVIMETDTKTMKCKTNVGGSVDFDVDNTIASLKGF